MEDLVQSQPLRSSLVNQGSEREIPGWERDRGKPVIYTWENLVRLQGTSKNEAKLRLAERDGRKCQFDGIEEQNLDALTLHHIDGIRYHNHRSNLFLAHLRCNVSFYHRKQKVVHPSVSIQRRENENGSMVVAIAGSEMEAHWSGKEGEAADKMNYYIDEWLNDMDGGPFVLKLANHGKVLVPVELKDLALMGAAYLRSHPKVKRGSNITVERYLWIRSVSTAEEPAMLKIKPEGGVKMVEYQGKNRFIVSPEKPDKTGGS